jgi:pimeloyl-ACP methyl ester carboxylesterase
VTRPATASTVRREPGVARRPDTSGVARRPDTSGVAISPDGVRLAYDVYGSGAPTIVLLPSTPIIHARQWKAQIPFLSRHYRVVAFDGRGNGRSDRPTDPAAYTDDRISGDILTVLDATGTDRAILVGLCSDGVWRAILLAASRPERVEGIVAFAVGVPRLSPPHPHYTRWSFDDELPTDDGWAKLNRHYWRSDYAGFARFFFGEITSEPHSTKAIEDAVDWAIDGSVDAMIADAHAAFDLDRAAVEAICLAVRCPMLLVHGTEDNCQPLARAERLSELTGAPLVVVEGADHMIPGRHPVIANLLIRDFVRSLEEDGP